MTRGMGRQGFDGGMARHPYQVDRGLKAMSSLRAYICSGGKVTSEQVKKKDQEGENADKRHKFTLNLEEILGPVISELGCITVLGTRKVTPLYTTLKGICHGGFDFYLT